MSEEILYLYDPAGRLLQTSELLGRASARPVRDPGRLLELLRQADRPVAAIVDALETPDDLLLDGVGALPSSILVLAAVRDLESASRWLLAGATDVMLPEALERGELELRARRLLRWRGDLLSVEFAESLCREHLRHIAHELKTPLNCVFGYLQIVLATENVPEAIESDLNHALRGAEDLLRIIETMGRGTDDAGADVTSREIGEATGGRET